MPIQRCRYHGFCRIEQGFFCVLLSQLRRIGNTLCYWRNITITNIVGSSPVQIVFGLKGSAFLLKHQRL